MNCARRTFYVGVLIQYPEDRDPAEPTFTKLYSDWDDAARELLFVLIRKQKLYFNFAEYGYEADDVFDDETAKSVVGRVFDAYMMTRLSCPEDYRFEKMVEQNDDTNYKMSWEYAIKRLEVGDFGVLG